MGSYSVERTIAVNAPAERLHALIDDFHQWTSWSPWEELDPSLDRSYSGPESGAGARYEWSGNRRAGRGSMEIISSTPERVEITLQFLKPFKSTSQTSFELSPEGPGTSVRWLMTGEQTGMMAVFGKVMNMDKLIGPDFEKGLARMKAVAEESA